MKNPLRNVVVEYKNKRSRKASASLWGQLDLKTISREVEANIPQSVIHDRVASDVSAPSANMVENTVADGIPLIAAPEKMELVEAEQSPSTAGTVEPEKTENASDTIQKIQVVRDIVGKQKKRLARRSLNATRSLQKDTGTVSLADADTRTELTDLEIENASLKRELIEKLLSENEHLATMLARAAQRAE